MDNNPQLTIVCIATNRYLEYWCDLITSCLSVPDFQSVQFVLLTDRIEDIPEKFKTALGVRFESSYIPHEPWPLPTIKRYEYITRFAHLFKSPNLMYLDADMKFEFGFSFAKIISLCREHSLILVKHPGYFRPAGMNQLLFYLKYPTFILRDLARIFTNGGNGTWETNSLSTAFVPRKKRRTYHCGGVWFGQTQTILGMCEDLRSKVATDQKAGITARYHDESHLNCYASTVTHACLDPALCHDATYPQLYKIKSEITAVNKGGTTGWTR
jgi:hypothetical protein